MATVKAAYFVCFFFFFKKNEKDLNVCVGRVVQRSTKTRGVSISNLNLHSGPVATSTDHLTSVLQFTLI